MTRQVSCWVSVCLVAVLCSTVAHGSVVDAGSGSSATLAADDPAAVDGAAAQTVNQSAFDPDSVLMQIAVGVDGAAEWRIEYHFHLPTATDRAAFDSYREDIRTNRSAYTAAFADRIRPSVTAAERDTGREMGIENVSVSVREQRLARETGIVTYRFTWPSFARANETAIRVGDAIRGFYVGPQTTLTLTWPDRYELATAVPGPSDERPTRLSWNGELGFATDEPRVLLTAVPSESGGQGPSSGPGSGTDRSIAVLGAGGLVVAVLLAGGVVAARRTGVFADDEADGGSEPPAAAGDETAGAVPNDELLSDEERALAAIEAGGGRIKQQELAEACDWGASKTSRVVNGLADDGDVDVFRLGRENVVSLPEESLHD